MIWEHQNNILKFKMVPWKATFFPPSNRQEAAMASGHVALHKSNEAVCICEACTWKGGRLQTDRDTKLLYCWMFRLRISEHGPKTRSNRGRSSFTHFNGPRATTVAARGRFINSAISPTEAKQKAYVRVWSKLKKIWGVLIVEILLDTYNHAILITDNFEVRSKIKFPPYLIYTLPFCLKKDTQGGSSHLFAVFYQVYTPDIILQQRVSQTIGWDLVSHDHWWVLKLKGVGWNSMRVWDPLTHTAAPTALRERP